MTGSEPIGAGLLKGAVEKATKASELETAALLEEAAGSKEMKHAAKQRAHRIAVRETFLTKLFSPLAALVNLRSDYFDSDFSDDLAAKLGHLSEDEIAAPKASVAAPAIMGLGFSLDDPDLKEMYLNLLATASEKSRSSLAHPAFAEILRQLTGEEAAALVPILSTDAVAACRIHSGREGELGVSTVLTHLIDASGLGIKVESPGTLAMWIDNWVRLGLIYVAYDRSLVEANAYDWIDEDPFYLSLKSIKQAGSEESGWTNLTWSYSRGVLRRTNFGATFHSAVMSFETPMNGPPA
ncbi:DUF4393 domain-containing protein [Janibacter melonis]|uniref:DUF4393 domain-containing protein n=1 Tax=Janibacter melonis TaxID=262209 RepID=UPI00174D239C|nr:DUF4393 domain-containing protein [Janibacter melonis]